MSTPRYLGISRARKATSENAIDSAFEAQDINALRLAVWTHVSQLYRYNSPYLLRGESNDHLADIVLAEILRKLPWRPCDRPLTPISGKTKPSSLVNWLAKRRHLDECKKHPYPKEVSLDRVEYGEGVVADERIEALNQFLLTLPKQQRTLAQHCIANGRMPAAFEGILRKAETWSPTEPPQPCSCHKCLKQPRSSSEVMQMVDKLGCLPATLKLFKGLSSNRPRPEDWQWEPIRTQRFLDPWKTEGRRHTKPESTNLDDWERIPAQLYRQIMSGQE
jgi:hypothetical protein